MTISRRTTAGLAIAALTAGTALSTAAQTPDAFPEQTFDITNTSAVSVSGISEIEIKVGAQPSLVISEKSGQFDKIQVESTARELDIRRKRGSGRRTYKAVLTLPNLEKLDISGSTDGFVSGLNGGDVTFDVSGSADLLISGTCDTATYDVSGSIDVEAENLICQAVEIDASGSADLIVHAVRALEVDASGSVDVVYYGSPTAFSLDASGSVDVEQASQDG